MTSSNTPRFVSSAFAIRATPWLVLLAGAAILALRRPDQITNPQLWAEDGIFFFQAREMGLRALLTELAGYSQLAPRLIAALFPAATKSGRARDRARAGCRGSFAQRE